MNSFPSREMAVVNPAVDRGIRAIQLWITDAEVHTIWGGGRPTYSQIRGNTKYEADGVFVRYQRTKDGSQGYVWRNPLNGENHLWAIGKRDRRPFKLATVS